MELNQPQIIANSQAYDDLLYLHKRNGSKDVMTSFEIIMKDSRAVVRTVHSAESMQYAF